MSTEDRRSTSAKRRIIPQTQEELDRAASSVNRARQALRNRNKSTLWDKYSYHIVIGGFALVIIITVLTTVLGKTRDLKKTPVIEHDEIQNHNAEHTDFKLGENSFFQDQTLADAKKILNNFFSYKQSLSRCLADENTILETKYDFREKYPECASPVVDQKNCSSSFAIASASAISDRLCQATGKNVRLSAQEYLSCQEGAEGKECDGGAIASFLDFARRKGIVEESCIPYVGENGALCDKTAEARCDKHRISDYCVAGPQESIKRDIVKNGPSIGYIPIYRDFLVYKNGTYHVTDGVSRFQGGHAVKFVGWGQDDNGQGYWIIQNSWGKDWGMDGYAHVAFGQEDLMLDEYAFSPNVKTDKLDDTEALKEQPDQVDV